MGWTFAVLGFGTMLVGFGAMFAPMFLPMNLADSANLMVCGIGAGIGGFMGGMQSIVSIVKR